MTYKHPNRAKQKFEHALAAYPVEWKQYVISPRKICLQFSDVQCKTRAPVNKDGLRKTQWGTMEMGIDTEGTDIKTLALGVRLDLYPELITKILTAINQHHELYPEDSIKDQIREIIDGF